MRTFSLCFFSGTLLIHGFISLPAVNLWVWSAVVALILSGLAGYFFRLFRRWTAVLAFISLGFFYAWLHASSHINQQLPEKLAGQDLILTGVVTGLPVFDNESRRFIFAIETAERSVKSAETNSTKPVNLSGKIRLSWIC